MQDLERLNFLIGKASAIAGSNAALSRMLNVHSQTVSDWKRGKTEPSIEMQERMAAIAGMDAAPVIALAAVEKTGHEQAIALIRRLMNALPEAVKIGRLRRPKSPPYLRPPRGGFLLPLMARYRVESLRPYMAAS